jgi:hypothetical protein
LRKSGVDAGREKVSVFHGSQIFVGSFLEPKHTTGSYNSLSPKWAMAGEHVASFPESKERTELWKE